MAPHACQARQQILVLCQLHLQPTLPRAGTLGKNVEDQTAAVHDTHAQQLREHAHLGRGELVVHDDQVSAGVFHRELQLGRFALAEKGVRVRRIALLQHDRRACAARCFQQGFQLLEGLLIGVIVARQGPGIEAGQHRTVNLLLFFYRVAKGKKRHGRMVLFAGHARSPSVGGVSRNVQRAP